MAPTVIADRRERAAWVSSGLAGALAAAAIALGGGFTLVWGVAPTLHSPSFLWYSARALGLGAYVGLCALVVVGTWFRHPWRLKYRGGHGEAWLRLHAAFGAGTVGLVAVHVVFLAQDRFAGVGWQGALIPGSAHYRPVAVSLGVVAADLLVLIAVTARFAGTAGARNWLAIHRLAGGVFVVSWFHGVLAGTDAPALRWAYVGSGAIVLVLGVTRIVAGRHGPLLSVSEQRARISHHGVHGPT